MSVSVQGKHCFSLSECKEENYLPIKNVYHDFIYVFRIQNNNLKQNDILGRVLIMYLGR
jgi:hypothetical protein